MEAGDREPETWMRRKLYVQTGISRELDQVSSPDRRVLGSVVSSGSEVSGLKLIGECSL